MSKDWVVYAKPPFDSPENVLNYLGRYTHKMALSNHRIICCQEEGVRFKWRDYTDDNKEKVMTLKPDEFIGRFLSHVLPSGFMRIGCFGFLANSCKAKKVQAIRKHLNEKPGVSREKKDAVQLMLQLTGKDITICPICERGKWRRIGEIPSSLRKMKIDTS